MQVDAYLRRSFNTRRICLRFHGLIFSIRLKDLFSPKVMVNPKFIFFNFKKFKILFTVSSLVTTMVLIDGRYNFPLLLICLRRWTKTDLSLFDKEMSLHHFKPTKMIYLRLFFG